jgi:invasion protein IalB
VHWTLVCDALTGKRQVCFLEQRVTASDGTSLNWQVAQTADGHVMMIVKAPAGISEAAGLKLSFGGFERTEKGLRCDASSCISLMPFEGRVAEWMTSEANVGFGFETNAKPYQFTMSMDGFKQAVDAIPRGAPVDTASRDPETQDGRTKVRTARHQQAKESDRLVPLAANGIKKGF